MKIRQKTDAIIKINITVLCYNRINEYLYFPPYFHKRKFSKRFKIYLSMNFKKIFNDNF